MVEHGGHAGGVTGHVAPWDGERGGGEYGGADDGDEGSKVGGEEAGEVEAD